MDKNLFKSYTLLILFCIGVTENMSAQESKIIVWFNDGMSAEVLFDSMPEFNYKDGDFILKNNTMELSWPLASLHKFTFETSRSIVPTEVELPTEPGRLRMVKGIVYDLQGRIVKKNVESISELPKGEYIVKDGNVTTKVLKR